MRRESCFIFRHKRMRERTQLTVLPWFVRQDTSEGWRFTACVTPRVVLAGLNYRLDKRHCACRPEHPCLSPHPREGGSVGQEGGVPIARRILRLLRSIGPLSRWRRPRVGTASHSQTPGRFSPTPVWPAPSSSAAPGCGSSEPHNAQRNVTSTTNYHLHKNDYSYRSEIKSKTIGL